jgi:hypothetical protein
MRKIELMREIESTLRPSSSGVTVPVLVRAVKKAVGTPKPSPLVDYISKVKECWIDSLRCQEQPTSDFTDSLLERLLVTS